MGPIGIQEMVLIAMVFGILVLLPAIIIGASIWVILKRKKKEDAKK